MNVYVEWLSGGCPFCCVNPKCSSCPLYEWAATVILDSHSRIVIDTGYWVCRRTPRAVAAWLVLGVSLVSGINALLLSHFFSSSTLTEIPSSRYSVFLLYLPRFHPLPSKCPRAPSVQANWPDAGLMLG